MNTSPKANLTPVAASASSPAGFLGQDEITARLRERFGAAIAGSGEHAGQTFVVVAKDDLLAVLEYMKSETALRFDYLSDVTVVDHHYLEVPEVGERFAVVYNLTSLEHGHRFRIKTPVSEDEPRVPTASELWKAALWGEREAHDMFGVVFEGHPDLRRLLMPADYDGFPLRKDYPLRGHGERDAFPKLRRIDSPDGASAEEEPEGGGGARS